MMFLGLALSIFALLLLGLAALLLGAQRRNRRELRALADEVEYVTDLLRTPAEREAIARRAETIEAQKRMIFGIFDHGGP